MTIKEAANGAGVKPLSEKSLKKRYKLDDLYVINRFTSIAKASYEKSIIDTPRNNTQ